MPTPFTARPTTTPATVRCELPMSDENKPADFLAQWTETWRSIAGDSSAMSEAWSKSVLPFILARATESKSGMGAGNELAEAIERMAQGPRLADVVDFDRKLL